MRELRRTRAGAFTEEGIVSMYDLLELSTAEGDEKELLARKIIRPMEAAFDHVPKIVIRDSAVNAICHGADLAVPGIVRVTEGVRPKQSVALLTLKDEPVDTYPRMWKGAKPAPSVSSQQLTSSTGGNKSMVANTRSSSEPAQNIV
jgi:tRNA U55 pseudouridine synthase TruB